jgi:hypothetical protein
MVKARGREICRAAGCYYVPVITGGMCAVGTPDALVCWRGRFIAIEYKAGDSGRLTEPQRRRLREVRAAGGIALVVRGMRDTEPLNLFLRMGDEYHLNGIEYTEDTP